MTFNEFINNAKEQKLTPLLFISNELKSLYEHKNYLKHIANQATMHKIEIVDENKIENLSRKKYLIMRYGSIGRFIEARLIRNGCKFISGCLE